MKQVITVIEDDLDGTVDAETYQFHIDGWTYEIDLCEANYDKLRQALAPYIDAGRRIAGKPAKATPPKPQRATTYRTTHVPASNTTIRAWWRSNPQGLPRWAPNGRIPAQVKAAWDLQANAPQGAPVDTDGPDDSGPAQSVVEVPFPAWDPWANENAQLDNGAAPAAAFMDGALADEPMRQPMRGPGQA